VNALVLQFRGMQVSVLGQVNRPGKFPLEQSQNRLTEVLALAGGVTALGADVVTVITKDGDGEQRIEVDLPAIMQAGDRAKDIAVKNGDVVFVPRYPVYYIYGEVQRPGQYRLERGMTVMQALATGGGLTPLGTESGLRLTRKQPNGGVTTREAATSDLVQPDDVVFVRESFF
jgi:polysaccharide export outer membrane protein